MHHCWTDPSPSFRVRKLQLGFERLDLLLLDDMVEDLPVGQMGIGLSSILKQLPQCHPKSPEHRTISTDECFSASSGVTTLQQHFPMRKLLFSSKNGQRLNQLWKAFQDIHIILMQVKSSICRFIVNLKC